MNLSVQTEEKSQAQRHFYRIRGYEKEKGTEMNNCDEDEKEGTIHFMKEWRRTRWHGWFL